MAETFDPFGNYDPNKNQDRVPSGTSLPQFQGNPPSLADEWRAHLQDSQNRAALMQFGLALAQPIGPGQTKVGHVAQAIGAGGEASDRVAAQARADTEAESKQDLRGAQATAAEARAAAAGERTNTATARLENARDRLAMQKYIADNRNNTQLLIEYDREKNRIRNANALAGADEQIHVPTLEEFLMQRGAFNQGGGGALGTSPASPGAGAVPSTSTPNEKHIKYLREHANDPVAREQFDLKFGVGSSARILGY